MTETSSSWYTSWFDTPFYHILYKDRDYSEAQDFMTNLTEYLNMPEHGTIMDLACGKGRHSVFLNTLGYNVLGVDLSQNSIAFLVCLYVSPVNKPWAALDYSNKPLISLFLSIFERMGFVCVKLLDFRFYLDSI